MKKNILGVKVDFIDINEAVSIVNSWIGKKGKHYIVTPNPEMIVDSLENTTFRNALNKADLAIPDSSRLGWAQSYNSSTNVFNKILHLPQIFLPNFLDKKLYPVTTGVDLTECLIKLAEEKGYRTAYLGGSKRVADKLFKCLRVKYPTLKIEFCSGNILVNTQGEMQFDTQNNKTTQSKNIKSSSLLNVHTLSKKVDILFVAFGHIKQEIWMQKNLPKLNARIMVGVGGSFDYISGSVSRAPEFMRSLGLEWLFRFIIQPWRIKRFWKLPYFVYLVAKD